MTDLKLKFSKSLFNWSYKEFKDLGAMESKRQVLSSGDILETHQTHSLCNAKLHIGKHYETQQLFKFCPKCEIEIS